MTEQPIAPQQGPRLLTAEAFLELLFEYADNNLDTIAKFWAMPGEGWEDSLRTALTAYIEGKHLWADLGEPGTRKVYTTTGNKPKVADFVLNGSVANYYEDEVIVEVKTQSIGRAKDFRNDFQKDIAKLDGVDDNHLHSQRLAIGIFFTRDYAQGEKGATDPVETEKVSVGFTEWLQKYDHVYFSKKYQMLRRPAGTRTQLQLDKAGPIHTTAPTAVLRDPAVPLRAQDVRELGIVYKLLGPKVPPTPPAPESPESSESSDSVFETKKTPKRKLTGAPESVAKKVK
ncbi:hypothetical protein AB0I81_55125 [Nonomuraea sp. NPDC050404]|uniref:hypothetical protein n=1 Tax=Nonomuraea sp. NPDC050404 TaxID=3155783 RepID=UPI0033CB486B